MDSRVQPGNDRKTRKHNAAVAVTMAAIGESAAQAAAEVHGLEVERTLVQYMHLVGGMVEMNAHPKARFPRAYYDLVFTYGRLWTPGVLPDDIAPLPKQECFSNALSLAIAHDYLTYVEGYAHSALIPTAHAWVVDEEGIVIDPTWDTPETNAYYGIAFDTDFAIRLTTQQGYYGLLGNDWLQDAQMLTHGLVMDETDTGLSIAIAIGED